jgi:carboxyl-terminal processing protease
MDKKLVLLLIIGIALLFGGALAVVGLRTPPAVADHQNSNPTELFGPLREAYQQIKDNFYQPDKAADQKLLGGSIEGMLKQLDDPYSVFFTAPAYQTFSQQFDEKPFAGIGVYINLANGQLTVAKTIPGGPAAGAGVRAGDIILEISGQSTEGITLDEASMQLRGPVGTSVVVKAQHLDGTLEDIKITRAEIHVPSVEFRAMDNGLIGYIKITDFNNPTSFELSQALQELQKNPIKGLVLDLRDNPGGLLSAAVEVASFFIDRGIVLTEETRSGTQTYTSRGNQLPNWPMAILVNRNTASAAEIVSGALRDQSMGILIGEKTFGKGVVQTTHEFGDGSAMKLTTGEYHTPKGRKVQGVGLPPDIAVPQPDEALAQFLNKLHAFIELFPSSDQGALQNLNDLRKQAGAIQIQLENDQFAEALAAAHAVQTKLEAERTAFVTDGGLIAEQQLSDLADLLTQLESTLKQNDFTAATDWLTAHFGKLCPCELPPLPQPAAKPNS